MSKIRPIHTKSLKQVGFIFGSKLQLQPLTYIGNGQSILLGASINLCPRNKNDNKIKIISKIILTTVGLKNSFQLKVQSFFFTIKLSLSRTKIYLFLCYFNIKFNNIIMKNSCAFKSHPRRN